MSTDERVKEFVNLFVAAEDDWLRCSLKRVQAVSNGRQSATPYGFEWLVQTAFSYWLLQQAGITGLRLGEQGDNGKKYDIDFTFKGPKERVIIELKTIGGPGDISYVKTDVDKKYPPDCRSYFLVFGYPYKSTESPHLEGASAISTNVVAENFRYYLYKKTTTQ